MNVAVATQVRHTDTGTQEKGKRKMRVTRCLEIRGKIEMILFPCFVWLNIWTMKYTT